VVQDALAQHLNDLQPSNSILRRSNRMRDLLIDTQAIRPVATFKPADSRYFYQFSHQGVE